MLETYFLFVLATFSLAIAPGPDNIFVLTQSVARGARYGIAIASGLVSGCIVHTALVAFGFAVVVKNNEWLLLTIKMAGAMYLVYLAYKVYSAPLSIALHSSRSSRDLRQSYIKGIAMNLLNPKVTLFFLALLPQFVSDTAQPEWVQIFVLGGIFMGVSLVVFYAIALLAGQLAQFIKNSRWFPMVIKWLQIIVFLGIAIAIAIP